jgi:hypothetical protein
MEVKRPMETGKYLPNISNQCFSRLSPNLRVRGKSNKRKPSDQWTIGAINHFTSEAMDLLMTAPVRIVTFAPHTIHIVGLLDLTLFGTYRQAGKYHLSCDNLTSTPRLISRSDMDFKKTPIPANI